MTALLRIARANFSFWPVAASALGTIACLAVGLVLSDYRAAFLIAAALLCGAFCFIFGAHFGEHFVSPLASLAPGYRRQHLMLFFVVAMIWAVLFPLVAIGCAGFGMQIAGVAVICCASALWIGYTPLVVLPFALIGAGVAVTFALAQAANSAVLLGTFVAAAVLILGLFYRVSTLKYDGLNFSAAVPGWITETGVTPRWDRILAREHKSGRWSRWMAKRSQRRWDRRWRQLMQRPAAQRQHWSWKMRYLDLNTPRLGLWFFFLLVIGLPTLIAITSRSYHPGLQLAAFCVILAATMYLPVRSRQDLLPVSRSLLAAWRIVRMLTFASQLTLGVAAWFFALSLLIPHSFAETEPGTEAQWLLCWLPLGLGANGYVHARIRRLQFALSALVAWITIYLLPSCTLAVWQNQALSLPMLFTPAPLPSRPWLLAPVLLLLSALLFWRLYRRLVSQAPEK